MLIVAQMENLQLSHVVCRSEFSPPDSLEEAEYLGRAVTLHMLRETTRNMGVNARKISLRTAGRRQPARGEFIMNFIKGIAQNRTKSSLVVNLRGISNKGSELAPRTILPSSFSSTTGAISDPQFYLVS
jgi:hypothetical protein